MKFQLDFSFSPPPQKISYSQQIVLAGSCFAENIGEKFLQNKFHVLINPYGILFNPHSLATGISGIIQKKMFSERDIFEYNGLWNSFQHHGSFSAPSVDETLKKINSEIEKAHSALERCGWLIITFGSAYAYVHKKTKSIVANCHKIPNSEFEKIILEPGTIVSHWEKCISELESFNPGLKIIFTVSPVRYVRDGLVENNRSKSALLLAVHKLAANKNCSYFPAYELVNDVLRDYRFFKEDMAHPNQQAIDFVWEKFCEALLDDEAKKVLEETEAFYRLRSHHVLHPAKEKEFLQKVREQEVLLRKKYPELKWD